MKVHAIRLIGLGLLPLACVTSSPGETRTSVGNPLVTVGAGEVEVGLGAAWRAWYVIDTSTQTCWLKLGESAGQMSCCDLARVPEARRHITWIDGGACAASRAVAPVAASAPAEKPEDAAIKGALTWLALVDEGQYAESWDAAARAFQAAITRDKWKDAVSGVRGPLGKLISRAVASSEVKTSLPGAPDGKYVVIQLNASFENKRTAVETVTPMQEADGSWKVSGYFIR